MPLVKPAYLTDLGATKAATGAFLAFLWCFLTTLVVPVAGAVGSALGASAANIIGTATAVASKVIAIFFMGFDLLTFPSCRRIEITSIVPEGYSAQPPCRG